MRTGMLLAAAMLFVPVTARGELVASIVACQGKEIALYKWDVVALETNPINQDADFTKHVLTEGSCKHLVKHQNAYYAFVDGDNARAFAMDPERYLARIAFGGMCAMGFAGYEPKGVPPHATLAPKVVLYHGGSFYFQTDPSKAALWSQDPDGNIARGLRNLKEQNFTVRTDVSFTPAHPEE